MPTGPNSRAGDNQDAEPEAAVLGAGGVVFDSENHVLLLQRQDGDWVFPKGHIEPGETPLQAALREIEEESGLRATCDSPQLNWVTDYTNAAGVRRHVTWFACRAREGAPRLTEELFVKATFLEPKAAVQRLTYRTDRKLLETVLAATNGGRKA